MEEEDRVQSNLIRRLFARISFAAGLCLMILVAGLAAADRSAGLAAIGAFFLLRFADRLSMPVAGLEQVERMKAAAQLKRQGGRGLKPSAGSLRASRRRHI